MTVTIDTNILDRRNAEVISRARELGFEVVQTSVTEREAGAGDTRARSDGLESIIETGVLDESPWERMMWASEEDDACFEEVLAIIADNGFPKRAARQQLSRGHRNQLRDAQIFCSHVREGRDLFVTEDLAAFVVGGRRELLEKRFTTRILTPQEFLETYR